MLITTGSDSLCMRGSAVDNCAGAAFKTIQLALLCMQSVSATLSRKDKKVPDSQKDKAPNPPVKAESKESVEEDSTKSEVSNINEETLKEVPSETPCLRCQERLNNPKKESIETESTEEEITDSKETEDMAALSERDESPSFTESHLRDMLKDLKRSPLKILFKHERCEADEEYKKCKSLLDSLKETYVILPCKSESACILLEEIMKKYEIKNRPLGIINGQPFSNNAELEILYSDEVDAGVKDKKYMGGLSD